MRLSVLAVLFALLAVASAQPCIECKDCRTDNCYRNCRTNCPRPAPVPGPIRPSDIGVSGDACKNRGIMYGPNAARSACDTTQKYCNGGRSSQQGARFGGVGPVNLAQCANIAMGSCQQNANNGGNWGHPCGQALRSGYSQCNAQAFRQFFEGETRDLCLNFAKSLTNVQPGTNQWASNPFGNLFPVLSGVVQGNGRRLLEA